VTASDHQSVTPSVASIALALFAPTVTASDHQSVTTNPASLMLTTFAPTVTEGAAIVTIQEDRFWLARYGRQT
jgi:hypothetical protein